MWRALLLAGWLAVCIGSSSALSEGKESAPEPLAQATLDIDHDGQADQARLVAASGAVDLEIYLGAGDGKPDPSRKPSFIKKDAALYSIGSTDLPELIAKKNGALLIKTGKSISNNHWSETLTIVQRNGEFLVAGLTYEETEADEEKLLHACDINFLTGEGRRKGKSAKGQFTPIKLSNWSDDAFAKACYGK